jgi:threonine dehydrogenase-like Zn-dependent dehydrogenase
MKAVVFNGPYDVSVEQVPDPRIENAGDAIVKIVAAGVCGSDLWTYRGQANVAAGARIGHEFLGVVTELGDQVCGLAVGDWVVCPFRFSCGECDFCTSGLPSSCVNGGFWGREAIDAGQGQYVRVPFATGTLVKIGDSNSAPDVSLLPSLLTLADVFPTGVHAVTQAGVTKGSTTLIIGDGAVGQCAIVAARRAGAGRIIVLGGQHSDREQLAKQFGASEFVTERGAEAIAAVLELTAGRLPDHVVECVGTAGSFDTALQLARPGSTVGYVGLPHGVTLDLARLFGRNIGIAGGVAPARKYIPELLPEVLSGAVEPGAVFTSTLTLDEAPLAYQLMDERRTIKVLLTCPE